MILQLGNSISVWRRQHDVNIASALDSDRPRFKSQSDHLLAEYHWIRYKPLLGLFFFFFSSAKWEMMQQWKRTANVRSKFNPRHIININFPSFLHQMIGYEHKVTLHQESRLWLRALFPMKGALGGPSLWLLIAHIWKPWQPPCFELSLSQMELCRRQPLSFSFSQHSVVWLEFGQGAVSKEMNSAWEEFSFN